jgi:hypothetical protein
LQNAFAAGANGAIPDLEDAVERLPSQTGTTSQLDDAWVPGRLLTGGKV